MEAFSISAKNLAALNQPDVDLSSYWYLLHLSFRHPWDIFPAIFGHFDRRQKRMAHLHIDRIGSAPASFGDFSDGLGYLKVGRMKYWDQATNITINAEPDDVFKLKNGKLSVVDYKTAKYSKGQDELLPLYNAQLSTYCWLIEKLGHGDVSKAALIYFEPVLDDSDDDLLKTFNKKGFRQDWITTPVAIEIDRKKTDSLLKVARKLYDMSSPPECNDNCRGNCDKIAAVYKLCRSVALMNQEAAKSIRDAQYVRAYRKAEARELEAALAELGLQDAKRIDSFDLSDWWEWEEAGED